ncbi:Inosose dehydratase [compost metagenome]
MSRQHPYLLSGLGDEAGQSLGEQIRAHLDLGWEEIELRSLQGEFLSDWDYGVFLGVCRDLAAAGLRVTVIDSRIANWSRPITAPFEQDEEELKILADRMHTLGSRNVRVMSYPNDGLPEDEWRDRVVERMHRLTELAAKNEIVLLHENCSGWGGESPENCLYLIQKINHPAFRLLFDTGNGIAYKYDAFQFLQQVWPYVEHVHIKDGMRERNDTIYTLPGEGHSKVRECVKWLYDHDYRGILAIEPHLHLIPHLQQSGGGSDMSASYITYGRHFERWLADMFSSTEGGVFI